jgi:Leucine-rich repeat (LRR) protein
MFLTKEYLESRYGLYRERIILVNKNIIRIDKNAFSSFKNLKRLDLGRNKINNLSFLKNLNFLEELWLDRNEIKNINKIYKLKKLKRLDIRFNETNELKMNKLSLDTLSCDYDKIKKIKFFNGISIFKYINYCISVHTSCKIKKSLSYYTF